MKKVLIAGFLLALSNAAVASSEDELTSLSYISYLERYATVQPSSQEESLEAVINMPLVAGDRVDTAREARMEVVLADGNYLWLDEYTTLSLDAVSFSRDTEAERTVIFLAEGLINFEVTEFALSERPVRIDSRGATIYLDERGLYRIQALANGGLRVEVISGLAEAATTAGGVLVRAQSSAEVGSGEVQRSETSLSPDDDFAAWVDMRRQVAAGESTQYVDLRYSRQAAQLDNYGSWVYVNTINSWAWQPAVGGSWQPYRAGRWYWTAPGWAWISYEPWGWLPYHYGSWYLDAGFGWVWSWGSYWGPAWVNWVAWPGYVGWCPYGYYNSWYWNSYGGYYPGYYPPYRPPYPGGGGGGYAQQPPRRDVVPPRTVSARGVGEAGHSRATAQPAVDIKGRVRMASVDRRGWTVARQEDFASPDLARLSRSGERAMPTEGEQMGVVMTGPLATRSPGQASPRSEIERVFRGVEARTPTDVSPLLARDGSLSSDTVQRLAQPTTIADLSHRSASASATNREIVAPRLSTGAGSPLYSSGTQQRTQPNVYRPSLSTGNGSISGSLGGSRSIGGRQLVTPGTGLGATSRPSYVSPGTSTGRSSGSSRPVIVPPTGSSTSRSPTSGAQSRGSSVRSQSSGRSNSGSSTAPRPSSTGGSRSSSGGSSRGAASSSRPSGGASSSRPSSSGSSGSRQQ